MLQSAKIGVPPCPPLDALPRSPGVSSKTPSTADLRTTPETTHGVDDDISGRQRPVEDATTEFPVCETSFLTVIGHDDQSPTELHSEAMESLATDGPVQWSVAVGDLPKTAPAGPEAMLKQLVDQHGISLRQRVFAPGEHLLRQGDQAVGLIWIRRGDVEVLDAEQEKVIDRHSGSGMFGEMSLISGRPCSADVIAKSPVHASLISIEDYRRLRSKHPELEKMFGTLISGRLGSADHDALCGKRLGGYEIQRCLARGGMGVVYQAVGEGQPVALKMLMHKFIMDHSMQQRFESEAKLLASLDHPNIIRLVDHFTEFRTRFLVLELCDGEDLHTSVSRSGPLNADTIDRVLGQIAAGLAEAHAGGIVHRDLKLPNLLIDRRGNIQIADFGLSRLRQIDVQENTLVGTPTAMAPELFDLQDSGVAVDYYALGCLLHELLTARPLFKRQSLRELIKQKRTSDPKQLLTPEYFRDGKRNGEVREDHRELLCTLLNADPAKRQIDLTHWSKKAGPVPELCGQ